jgi:DNA-binding winged helix-turn-helix (wHTH) protein
MARRNVEYIFENHRLDTDRRELRRGREPIPVEPQVFDLLVYLCRTTTGRQQG